MHLNIPDYEFSSLDVPKAIHKKSMNENSISRGFNLIIFWKGLTEFDLRKSLCIFRLVSVDSEDVEVERQVVYRKNILTSVVL